MPVTLIGESVFARCLSSLKSERIEASKVLKGPASSKYTGDKKQFIDHIKKVGNYNIKSIISSLYNVNLYVM